MKNPHFKGMVKVVEGAFIEQGWWKNGMKEF